MRFNKLKILTLVSCLALGTQAFAEEKAAPPAEAGGEEGKAGAAPMNKEEKEFNDKTAKINTLSNRIVESEKHFNELVHSKEEAKGASEKQKIIQEMLEVAKSRNKDVEEYNKVKMDLQLRYPNQGQNLERRYQTQSKRSIEELEGVAGLDELLTRVKKVVEKKFAAFDTKEDKTVKKKAPAASEDDKPKRLKLEK